MATLTEYLLFNTEKKREFVNITDEVRAIVARSGIKEGMVLISTMHLTAGVVVHDTEPGLEKDIIEWAEKLAPAPHPYHHHASGESNGDAHLKSLLLNHYAMVPITRSELDLGPWQEILYLEFDGQRKKRVVVKVMGEL